MMNTLEKMANMMKTFNILALVIFLLQNATNLTQIPFTNPITGNSFYISIITFILVILAVMGLVAISGTNVAASGLNEGSTATIRKVLFTLLEITIYITPIAFYLFPFGNLGMVIILIDIVFIMIEKLSKWSEE